MNKNHYPPVTGPAAWRGNEVAAGSVRHLTEEQALEIVEVARRHDASVETLASVAFAEQLPSFAPLMKQVGDDLLGGRGVALLRGLPVWKLSVEQASVAYWAIGSFLGQGVAQSSAGDLIGHVRDHSNKIRSYLNRSALRFHVDLADLVGLLCVRPAMSGGESLIASSLTVYNEMREHHPEYLEALSSGFHWSRNGEEGPGEAPFSALMPVFTVSEGTVSCRFNASMIRRGAQAMGATLSPLQEQALAYVEETAVRCSYSMRMEAGDIQFLNNYTVLHSRTEFQDWPQPEKHRLLLRLWLRREGVRNFGPLEKCMRDEPLIYGKQGRTPSELQAMQD